MNTIKLLGIALLFVTLAGAMPSMAAQASSDRQTRDVHGFHGISVSTGINLYLTQENSEKVVVEANADDLDKIITEVEGGILKIYIREKSFFNLNFNKNTRKVYVSFKMIDRLDASAGADIVSQSPLKLESLKMHSGSGSDIKLELEANDVYAESSSGSDITLKGKADTFEADASSGSDISAADFQTRKCNASASSGSDVRVKVTEEINANASSGGDISYSGDPKTKDINESSGGDVHQR